VTAAPATEAFPAFSRSVTSGGYCWWYLDAISDDGASALTIIAFVGSVFSPYYRRACRRGDADPADYSAINCALYGRRANRWTITERGAAAVERSADVLRIGPSMLAFDGRELRVDLRETAVPLPRPVRGTIRVAPRVRTAERFTLDAAGRHRWWPVAPVADVEIRMDRPALHWRGRGYLDFNEGSEPLAAAFREWHWSRAATGAGAAITYDCTRVDGSSHCLALAVDAGGGLVHFEPPPPAPLPPSRWRVSRRTRADEGRAALSRSLEDTPFYARSLVHTRLRGEDLLAVHESLSLGRFTAPLVQLMLPFRMPRR